MVASAKKAKAAFAEFRKKDSEWFHGNTYLFAYDMNANVLLNPAFPRREGTNVSSDIRKWSPGDTKK
jgi:cytochrome c